MLIVFLRRFLLITCVLILSTHILTAQNSVHPVLQNPGIYAGIDIGAKGVKLSVLEIGKNAKKTGNFAILKDTAINTDFISFTRPSFGATLAAVYSLYTVAMHDFDIPADHVFTVISSGVKIQAEKEDKNNWVHSLIDSFRIRINDPKRDVAVIDVADEARLSHLGIVPDNRRYSTFLIDIGSGNTKGGYFPNGNTRDFKLFQLTWGTKSTANATEKRVEDDKTIANYSKQLGRVLSGAAMNEIIYAVNVSGAYNMSDYIAFSGGIAWSIATLINPELVNNSVVPVTYDDVVKFSERLQNNYASVSDTAIARSVTDNTVDKNMVAREVIRVNKVFDQRSLIAGTGLLLSIMRQFEGVYEKKQFFLVKNGQVGWISAYVDQHIDNTITSVN